MTSTPSACDPIRFSTSDWAERDRFAMLRELCGRQIMKLDPAPLTDGPFHLATTMRAFPGLGTGSWTITNLQVTRTRQRLADGGSDDLLMLLVGSGVQIVSQRGRERTLRAGDACLMSMAETATMSYPSPSQLTSLRLPRRMLAPLVSNLDDAVMRPVPRDLDALRLLTRYTGLSGGLELATPELRHTVINHVYDLVALVIGTSGEAAAQANGGGIRAARLAAIKADIIQNLDRHDLTIGVIAARQRLTPRHAQRLLEAEGITFSEFVLRQRLIRAHRLLADPRLLDRSISTVAYEVGFGDLSYFNRTFRKLYGATPSDVRAATRRERR
ncbi:AraC family transcriptional regulator [Bradyrhizobium uaiense]|uniref:Helix-turn-helix domain-containing protein n=1 Tax=Bradyrhizobium uaiense TaxID=2594946 RepID=A0A6P1BQU8_9BRAD|nr:AraC family transcriptional regulator [Bradyrhizobium uaiense]NEV00061.1 helix-turn-helix domain-containing protein [Bradyrhizobium uaiense]